MREEPCRAALHAGEQIQERRVARQVRAERQDIRELADQRFQLRVYASGRRRDDHEVRLVRQTIHEGVEDRHQGHEQRGLAAKAPTCGARERRVRESHR